MAAAARVPCGDPRTFMNREMNIESEREPTATPWSGWAAFTTLGLVAVFAAACSNGEPTGGGSTSGEPAVVEARPPNVLLISLDTLRADRLGVYGYERPTSPFMDQLASAGAHFTDVSSPSSKTATSHMSMFTGMHPTVHGVRNCYTPDTQRVSGELPLLAEHFERAGYRTAAFTGGGMMTHELGFDRGFGIYDDQGGGADRVFPRAESWLREYAKTEGGKADPVPFFLFVHTYEIHDPYTPPAEWQARFVGDYQGAIDSTRIEFPENAAEVWKTNPEFYEEVQARFWGQFKGNDPADIAHMSDLYDAGIAYTDALLAELFGVLAELGLENEDLLVVLTSDHGDEFSEHGQMTHQTLYQGVLHVPLIVRWPGKVAAGLALNQPVQGADLMPSILELAELEPLAPVQGRSWVPSLSGEPVPWELAWSELGTPNNEMASMRWGKYKLMGDRRTRKGRLFDLDFDPAERFDGTDVFPELAVHMGVVMESLEKANLELLPKYPTIPVTLGDAAKGAMDALGYTGDDPLPADGE